MNKEVIETFRVLGKYCLLSSSPFIHKNSENAHLKKCLSQSGGCRFYYNFTLKACWIKIGNYSGGHALESLIPYYIIICNLCQTVDYHILGLLVRGTMGNRECVCNCVLGPDNMIRIRHCPSSQRTTLNNSRGGGSCKA